MPALTFDMFRYRQNFQEIVMDPWFAFGLHKMIESFESSGVSMASECFDRSSVKYFWTVRILGFCEVKWRVRGQSPNQVSNAS